MTGTYGVMSSAVASRMREFALRVALGADRRHLGSLVLGDGIRLAAIGVTSGLGATFVAAPLLEAMPVTIRPQDLVTATLASLLLLAIAALAPFLPALRASRVAPMHVLRNE